MTIVVGTDGTECGTAAVEWAAAEALRRHAQLRIVHAFDEDREEARYDIGNEYVDVARTLAEAVAAAARDRALTIAPRITMRSDAIAGPAVPRLLEAVASAELLVLGTRPRGQAFGSVSRRMIAQAPCPVAVVRGRPGPAGPVIAGIDDSPAADDVLAAAFEAAAERGCSVVVLTSRGRREPEPCLDQRLAPWRDRFPQVQAGTVLTADAPAAALIAGSQDAQLVVVGAGGHGALHRSVGRRLLSQAHCPVLVAR